MAQLGTLLVTAAALLAAAAATFGLLRSRRVTAALLVSATSCLAAATILLGYDLVAGDFSIEYVADHSRLEAAAPYRLAGLWGGMAGSLLWWTTLLALVSMATAWWLRDDEAAALTTGVLSGLVAGFAGINIATANPFHALQVPAIDGGGLQPVLEDPAMLYHPPLLYLGLVATAVPFALTIDALARGRVDDRWRQRASVSMVVAWTLLTAGLVTGAHWSYEVVGWGGFWTWDPVENGALVPWLLALAFVHLARTSHRRATGGLLAMAVFVTAVIGTLLTRSGAVSSVHAFAQARAVGWATVGLLAVLLLTIVWLVVRWGRRDGAPSASSGRWPGWLTSALLAAAAGLVLLGTVYPLVLSRSDAGAAAVEPRWFASVTLPLTLALLVSLGAGASPRPRELRAPVVTALAVTVVVAWFGIDTGTGLLLAAAGTFAIVAVGLRVVGRWRPGGERLGLVGAALAHLGIAVLLVGVGATTATRTISGTLAPGQQMQVGDLTVTNHRAYATGGGQPAVRADVTVERGSARADLTPTIVGSPQRGVLLGQPALWATPGHDVQVILRNADDNGRALLEVFDRPLVGLVWIGGVLLIGGGAVSALAMNRSRRPRPGSSRILSPETAASPAGDPT